MDRPPRSARVSRAARLYFAEPTPAVLRLESGANVPGRLKVVSVTGGLLSVAHPLERGSSAKLMFLTETGMVHGVAEMLSPLSWSVQPFRFVGLDRDDQNKLQTTIQRSIEQHRIERTQIESYRAW